MLHAGFDSHGNPRLTHFLFRDHAQMSKTYSTRQHAGANLRLRLSSKDAIHKPTPMTNWTILNALDGRRAHPKMLPFRSSKGIMARKLKNRAIVNQ